MKSAADIWVCSQCRSINPLKSGRCYRCSTPREVAAAKPEELTFATAQAAPKAIVPTGPFRPSETFALLTSLAAVAFIAGGLLALWTVWGALSVLAAEGGVGVPGDMLQSQALVLAIAPIAGVAALLAYAAWISRVVHNLTALGVGYSKVSPKWAFLEPLIPGVNLYALPTRMAEVARKLGGGDGMTVPLLGLAIVLFIVPAVAAGVLWRVTAVFASPADFVATGLPLVLIGFLCQSLAVVLGLIVIWQIEGMQRRRAETSPQPEPAGATAS